MKTRWGALAALGVSCVLGAGALAPAWAGRDVRAAQIEVDEARVALAAKRYVEAAERMEKAYALDPNPLWLANAGFARMQAGQLDRAIEALSAALADRGLDGAARDRAVERLGNASAAKAFIVRSEEAKAQGDLAAAARAYDEALAAVPIGPYALEAGTLWERARDWDRAADRYTQAAAIGDLGPDQQRAAAEALVRVARRGEGGGGKTPEAPPPDADPIVGGAPESTPPVAGWTLVGTGGAALATGVVLVLVGNSKASELQSVMGHGGVVDALTRAEALALEEDAGTYQTAGVIVGLTGLAIATAGAILVATHDDGPSTEGRVHVGAGPIEGGWLFTAGGTW